MSGTGYDLSTSIYSQDGRVFQIEYATKAVDNAETFVGLRTNDGIILACEKIRNSPLEAVDANRRIFSIEENIGFGICGRLPDGKNILHRARKEAKGYRKNFGRTIPVSVLAERLANYVHAHTIYSQFRPLGCTIFISGYDLEKKKFILYMIDNSGNLRSYLGCTSGKGKQTAKSHLERFDVTHGTEEGLKTVAKAIVSAHEEFKEKTYEFEVSVISAQSNFKHSVIDYSLRETLRRTAEEEIEENS
jgi:20S proteasome subunit alpha 7